MSNRSRKSLEEGSLDAYNNGGSDLRQIRGKGLSQSPSVISLHDQQAPRDAQITKPRRSKDSKKSRPDDEYSDEMSRITGGAPGPVALQKSNKKQISVIE